MTKGNFFFNCLFCLRFYYVKLKLSSSWVVKAEDSGHTSTGFKLELYWEIEHARYSRYTHHYPDHRVVWRVARYSKFIFFLFLIQKIQTHFSHFLSMTGSGMTINTLTVIWDIFTSRQCEILKPTLHIAFTRISLLEVPNVVSTRSSEHPYSRYRTPLIPTRSKTILEVTYDPSILEVTYDPSILEVHTRSIEQDRTHTDSFQESAPKRIAGQVGTSVTIAALGWNRLPYPCLLWWAGKRISQTGVVVKHKFRFVSFTFGRLPIHLFKEERS